MISNKLRRLETLDLMRGIFIVGIIINHLGLYPNFFISFTGRSKLWVSFAEGFFIVSGFILGYLNKDEWRKNTKNRALKIIKRAFKVYFWSIGLTLLFTFWGNFLPVAMTKNGLWQVHPDNLAELFSKIVTLRYVYGWADFLSYYSIYLFLTPLVIFWIERFGVLVPLLMSLLAWIFRGGNQYMAVQLVFFISLMIGFKFDWWIEKLSLVSRENIQKTKLIIAITFLVTLLMSLLSVFWFRNVLGTLSSFGLNEGQLAFLLHKNAVLNLYFEKRTLGVGRVFLAPIWFLAVLIGVNRYRGIIRKLAGGIFSNFGKRTLKIYILHALIIFLVPLLMSYFEMGGYLFNTLTTLMVLMTIYWIDHFTVTDLARFRGISGSNFLDKAKK